MLRFQYLGTLYIQWYQNLCVNIQCGNHASLYSAVLISGRESLRTEIPCYTV
jgi:hypothetical protein